MIEKVNTACGLCSIGCGIIAHVENGCVIKVEGDKDNPLNQGELCPRGLALLEYLYHPDRLKHPIKRLGQRGEGKWQTITWDEALDTVANGLAKARDKYGPESVAFIRGAFKGGYQGEYIARFANVFGSPNSTDMENVCFVPRINASRLTYGFYAIPDLDHPPACIVLWGKNPAKTLHHVYRRMMRAIEGGAKLVVISSTKIEDVEGEYLWLKLRPGSDLALALGMMHVIINDNLNDSDFVDTWTVGFDELRSHVQDYPPEKVADITWVPADMVRQAARLYATSKPACIQWGNAIDHGINSFQTSRALCLLRAITNNLEVPGGDVQWSPPPLLPRRSEPIRLSENLPAEMNQRRLTDEDNPLPAASFAIPQVIIHAMQSGDPYPVRAAYIQGCNPLLTYPNAQHVYDALISLDFLAVADIFLTPTAALADIVLPAATRLEFDGIMVPPYSSAVALAQQKVAHIGECRSDYEILRDLARKLGLGDYFWDTEEQCLDFILAPAGISFEEFRKVGVLKGNKHYRAYLSKGFSTPSGKVEIYSQQLKDWGFDPLPIYYEHPETSETSPELGNEYPLVFTSRKLGCYRHTDNRQISSLRGSHPEPVACINPETAKKSGIADGDRIFIVTKRGRIRQRAALSSDIDPRVIVVDYGWWFPEDGPTDLYGWKKANINILTDDKPPYNREMGSSHLRGVPCKISKA
jgi:anaerobic selenocysteine-containing dehydrogenase